MPFFCAGRGKPSRAAAPLLALLLLLCVGRLLYRASRFFYEEDALTAAALQFQARTIVIEKGEIFQLRLNWANGRVRYSSENSLIAAVHANGKLLGLKPGKTKVTAEAGGKTATSLVYVISFEKKVSLKKGETYRIRVRGAQFGCSYASENSAVASVSRFGTVSARRQGTTRIRITLHGFSFFLTVQVNGAIE